MFNRRHLILSALAFPLLPAALSASVFTEDGVAIRGYDPVAYFTQGQPVRGEAAHAAEWNGATWHFASADNRAAFLAEPEAYAPQYGGYCAFGVAQGALVEIDPHAWSIVDGKLYLNLSRRFQRRWERDIPGFIARADANWPNLRR